MGIIWNCPSTSNSDCRRNTPITTQNLNSPGGNAPSLCRLGNRQISHVLPAFPLVRQIIITLYSLMRIKSMRSLLPYNWGYCQVIVGNFLFDLSFYLYDLSSMWRIRSFHLLISSHMQQSFSFPLDLAIQTYHMTNRWIFIAFSIFLWCLC